MNEGRNGQQRASLFTVRQLLAAMTISGVVLGIVLLYGTVLGSCFCLLLVAHLVALLFSERLRIAAAILCALFATLPWLGLGKGIVMYPGADWHLPTIYIQELFPGGHLIFIPLEWLYSLAELPLHVVAICHPDIAEFVFFSGEGVATVQPFVVFAFWMGIAIAIAATEIVLRCEREHTSRRAVD